MEDNRKQAEELGFRARSFVDIRARGCSLAREAVRQAASVYARPARACRAILRAVRRHGVKRTRALLDAKPDFFGPLRVVKHPRGIWPLLLVFDSTNEAARCVNGFLANGFDKTLLVRGERKKAGEVQRTAARAAHHRTRLQELTATQPPSGALAEAGRLVAILCRRRDVDEPPQGKGPPTVAKQLAAMLPAYMHGLITEALKLAKSETGENPVWDRGRDGYGRELERSLGLDRDVAPSRGISRGWERGRDRSRGGGLEL